MKSYQNRIETLSKTRILSPTRHVVAQAVRHAQGTAFFGGPRVRPEIVGFQTRPSQVL
jgi:hypothetical protein